MKKNSDIAIIFKEKETEGVDPRDLKVEEFNQLGHYQKPILQVIKQNCMQCCGSNPDKPRNTMNEVKKCQAYSCPMWPYRMGKNPFTKKRILTEEQKQQASERFAKIRANKNNEKIL